MTKQEKKTIVFLTVVTIFSLVFALSAIGTFYLLAKDILWI